MPKFAGGEKKVALPPFVFENIVAPLNKTLVKTETGSLCYRGHESTCLFLRHVF
jgi:hypothetical protein